MRFPISITHNFLLEPIMTTFGAKRDVSYAEIHEGGDVEVRMGIWFHELIPLADIAALAPSDWPWWGGLGVKIAHHGIGVVGSLDGVVNLQLRAPRKMRVLIEVESSQIWISLEDRDGFLSALAAATHLPVSPARPFSS